MTNLTAVVLAAGEGKRMRPLGANVPKVMLPILGKPVLEHVLTNVINAGCQKIFLVVSPKNKTPIQNYFDRIFKGVKLEYLVQRQPLGPAHALSLAVPKIKSDYFLVQYGDSLADTNIVKNLITTLTKKPRPDGSIAVQIVDDPSRYGIVKYKNNQVVEIVEKPKNNPPSNHATIGVFILNTKKYRQAIQKVKFEYGKEEFPAEYILREYGKIVTWRLDGEHIDVGKPEDLFTAGQLLAVSPIKCIAFDADNTLYNTHQVAKFADLAAFKILADKTGVEIGRIYDKWQQIVEKVKYSKEPKKRTRLYSYNLLVEKLSQDRELAAKLYRQFSKNLLKRLQAPKNIKELLTSLKQTKIVITDDIKLLAAKKLKSVGLYKFFDEITTCEDTKTMKPSKKFYEKLLTKYLPEEILVVGDDYEKDLRIPATLGMQVLFIKNEDDFEKLEKFTTKRIHIMGIAGAGASSIAGIAKNCGYSVSGCDLVPNSPYIKNVKVDIQAGHDPRHLDDVDMLIVSPAVEKLDSQNQELVKARQLKIPILTWQKFQAKFLQKNKFVICVAGAYGKSTTTAMIAQILTDSGLDPTCEIGAKVLAWQSNFRVGKSKYYVCEGDEYNNNFLNYKPDMAIVLNIAWDHPDFFKTEKDLQDSYIKFINNIKPNGYLVTSDKIINLANKSIRQDIKITKIVNFPKIKLSLIGDFRKENASAALTAAILLGIDPKIAKKSVKNFKGVGRRLEFRGQIAGVDIFDDYAVQPYTILKTATSLKEKFKDKKVLLVLEPHTFSRTRVFFNDFVTSLVRSKVDQIYITDVYAAREKGNRIVLAQKLASAIGPKAKYTGSLRHSAAQVKKHLNDFDIICSMGAGDSYKLYDLIRTQ